MSERNSPPQQATGPRGRWSQRWRGLASALIHAPAAINRRLPGRPLTLALGWLLSCVLITAVTLTAVERVGREVSGSQGLITTQGVIKQKVAAQSASAASESSASLTPIPIVVASAIGAPTVRPAPPTPTPSHTPPVKSSVSPTTTPPTTPSVAAPPASPKPVIVIPPPGAVEYIYVCRDGLAVGGAVTPSSTPTPTPTPTPTATPSTSQSPPSPSVTPTNSATSSPSASPTTSPPATTSASVSSSPIIKKNFLPVPPATSPQIGQINITCIGDSIAVANATTLLQGYTLTVRSTTNPRVDVFFSKN